MGVWSRDTRTHRARTYRVEGIHGNERGLAERKECLLGHAKVVESGAKAVCIGKFDFGFGFPISHGNVLDPHHVRFFGSDLVEVTNHIDEVGEVVAEEGNEAVGLRTESIATLVSEVVH